MDGDAREAEKKRRRAEALRANLKRRKAASGAHRMPPAEHDERGAEANTSDHDTRGI